MTNTQPNQTLDLVRMGQSWSSDSWLISEWGAGQSHVMDWRADHVRTTADGVVELVLDDAGTHRPYAGGEIQSIATADIGTWSWLAQAPEMVDGAVFGMFLYKADWQHDPWLEYDFEFVGGDTTKVMLNIHMQDAAGRHISLDSMPGGAPIIELGFDAALAMHEYEITVLDTEAVFRIDGAEVARFDASDMPGNVWYGGQLKSFVDLWATPPDQGNWAGTWDYSGVPLVARIETAEVRPGDLGPSEPIAAEPLIAAIDEAVLVGTEAGETLVSGAGDDNLFGGAGHDDLRGGAGDDNLFGGAGTDTAVLEAGNDLLNGGRGSDWLRVGGAIDAVVNLTRGTANADGFGRNEVLNFENVIGGRGDDKLVGDGAANILKGVNGGDMLRGGAGDDRLFGGAGRDILVGGDGEDTLIGGRGRDMMMGGPDSMADLFVFHALADSAVGRNRDKIFDFAQGLDRIDLSRIDANDDMVGNQSFEYSGDTAQANSVWYTKAGSHLILNADVTGDGISDFQIGLVETAMIGVSDFIL